MAIDIALGGDLASIENEGSITATASVDGTDATAIRDASEATTANFGADSTFFTTFDPVNMTGSGYVLTTGTTSFDVGATIDVNFTSYLATTASLLIAEGGSIVGDAGIELGGGTAGYNAVSI